MLVEDVCPRQLARSLSRRIIKEGVVPSCVSRAKMPGGVRSMPINRRLDPSVTQTSHGVVGIDMASKIFTPRKIDIHSYPACLFGIAVTCVTQFVLLFCLHRAVYGAQVEEEPYSLKLWTLMRMRPELDEQNHREGNRR